MQAAIPAQAMAVPRSGCGHDQRQGHQHWRSGGQQRVAPVVDGLDPALQKIREEQNQNRLGQLRGLEGEAAGVNPAMSVVRAIEEEDRDQQQRGHAHQREDDRGMLVAAVVHPHGDDHSGESGDGPDQLLRKKGVARSRSARAPSPQTPKIPSPDRQTRAAWSR